MFFFEKNALFKIQAIRRSKTTVNHCTSLDEEPIIISEATLLIYY
ncbi:MAG: hypothetical protein ACI8YQ_004782 [Polaribacter sp.]|jgi:hypothetical protein